MFRLLRMRRFIKLLTEFSDDSSRPVVHWYKTAHKNLSAFLDFIIDESYFGLGPLGRLYKFFGIQITQQMRDQKKKHVYQALEKAKRPRNREGYSEAFAYIVHPLKETYDLRELGAAFTAAPRKIWVPDDSYVQVTPQGVEFLTPSWFLHDVWQECNRAFVIIGGILFGSLAIAFYKYVLTSVCQIDQIHRLCAAVFRD